MTRASRKHVHCFCYGPIAFGPHYKSPWEDVWLKWKGKPGRKTYRAAPTLICRAEILVDMQIHEEIRSRDDTYYANQDQESIFSQLGLTDTPKEVRDTWYREDDRVSLKMLETLGRQPYATDAFEWNRKDRGLANVYTSASGIDRKEAERMLAFYLASCYGIRNPKFVWRRPRPAFCVEPAGFGDYSAPAILPEAGEGQGTLPPLPERPADCSP